MRLGYKLIDRVAVFAYEVLRAVCRDKNDKEEQEVMNKIQRIFAKIG